MLFLLNDKVICLDADAMSSRLAGVRVSDLGLPMIIRLGQEVYAEDPLLQHARPERALRLASLISAKAPIINAILFVAPHFRCAPHEVAVRFVNAEFEVMAELYNRQQEGRLDAVSTDKLIWGRLAA